MSKPSKRRTQAERSELSQRAIISSACRLFGSHGYNKTSIETIAKDCDMTIGSVFHHYKNKKLLFEAVVCEMENRMLAMLDIEQKDGLTREALIMARWHCFVELAKDPQYRQIVLIDCPNVLGKDRLINSNISLQLARYQKDSKAKSITERYRHDLALKMTIVALIEAAMTIADAENPRIAQREAELLVRRLIQSLYE